MTNRFGGVLFDALRVAAAAWIALWIDPWTQETFPMLPVPVRFLMAAIIAAVTLEFLLQVLIGWPRINIEWTDRAENAPLSEIRAKIRESTSESQPFHFEVAAASGGWLGHQILKLYFRAETTLHIQIERALIVPTCEHSSRAGTGPGRVLTVTADDSLNGFAVLLGRAPHRPSVWHFADVRWRDESTPIGSEFRIYYRIHHTKWFVRVLLNLLVRRTSNAQFFRVVGP